jgi:glyoxylase-like metal-dependent hydrolase (beta-lactamase superfamily II)
MNVAPGVEMLELTTNMMGRTSTVHPTLLVDKDSTVLVDTGYPNQLQQIRQEIEKAGVPFERLDTIVITHHDIDHIGSLASLVNALPGRIKVLAHSTEIPYIQGEVRPLKLAAMEDNLASLPESSKAFYQLMKSGFQSAFARVDRGLSDGEKLPYCGGITVVFTPGHTLGHICLYLDQYKLLIGGDALRIEEGRLAPSPASINYDMDLYNSSLKKLAQYDIDKVISYHSGLFSGNFSQGLANIISS